MNLLHASRLRMMCSTGAADEDGASDSAGRERWSGGFVVRDSGQIGSPAGRVRVGFVPLLDAAPLIAARELGLFAGRGVGVTLSRQIGWGNVRDKLTFGQLDASHAPAGMPPLSVLGREQLAEPLVAIAALGTGGNTICLSRRLSGMGIRSAEALARHVTRSARSRRLVFAHVFGCSSHHYLLRDWLAAAGIDPDRDVELCVLPPPQMVRQTAEGHLDGFCVGEPWGTLAESAGHAAVVAHTGRLQPDHPEKVLAASRRWAAAHADASDRIVAALTDAAHYCADPANAGALAGMLAAGEYLNCPTDVIARCLEHAHGQGTWSPQPVRPSGQRVAWVVRQMVRWKHLPDSTDVAGVCDRSVDETFYQSATSRARAATTPAV